MPTNEEIKAAVERYQQHEKAVSQHSAAMSPYHYQWYTGEPEAYVDGDWVSDYRQDEIDADRQTIIDAYIDYIDEHPADDDTTREETKRALINSLAAALHHSHHIDQEIHEQRLSPPYKQASHMEGGEKLRRDVNLVKRRILEDH